MTLLKRKVFDKTNNIALFLFVLYMTMVGIYFLSFDITIDTELINLITLVTKYLGPFVCLLSLVLVLYAFLLVIIDGVFPLWGFLRTIVRIVFTVLTYLMVFYSDTVFKGFAITI